MIVAERAREICYTEINRPTMDWPDKPELVITEVVELDSAWVVYYTSSTYLQTRDINDALAGNGPYVISKSDGRFVTVGTALPLQDGIAEALRFLGVEANGDC